MNSIGKKIWVIPAGNIPFKSTGKEPEFLSRNSLSILNTTDDEAKLSIEVFYADKDTPNPFELKVKAQRMRKIRVNDLIDPFPVPLEKDYALKITSDKPILVQYSEMNTGQNNCAIMGTIAFGTN
jgi:hypothetical protein